MSISSLHILSKNTDATSSLKGYEYQVLKTLEAWLENRLANSDEQIYCDYEEDVFRYNVKLQKAHFKQLKLYSRNFSFASEEVKKALAHFFMLYVKGEYTYDELEFVFESNSDISQKRSNNNAEILRDWCNNQNNLSDETINKILSVVKPILENYVEDRVESPSTKEKSGLQKAAIEFQNLPDEVITEFIKKVKWNFSDLKPDIALMDLREKVKTMVKALPFEGAKENAGIFVSSLHYEVWHRATQTKVEDKVLDNALLDKLVLQIGSDEDKKYEAIYTKWEASQINSFIPGEFYEIIDASEYCRTKSYLKGHSETWKRLLNYYYEQKNIPDRFKRKAIYELCLLSLRNDPETYKPDGNIIGHESKIKDFFSEKLFDIDEISDAFTLLTIVSTAQIFGLVELTDEEVAEWSTSFAANLEALSGSTSNIGDICTIYEIKGHYNYIKNGFDANYLIDDFEKIIPLLDDADTFSTLAFYDRINLIIKQSIKFGKENADENIEILQRISDKIEPFASKREGAFKLAKKQINIGATYLETSNPKYLLKSIEEFQKAKDNYKASESMEGYILALLNLGQVYMAAGMVYAAKYYFLCAIWRIMQINRPELAKRLTDSMVLLILADFRAGAWLSVLDDFVPFLNFHLHFSAPTTGPFDDARLQKVLAIVSLIFSSAPIIQPNISEHLDAKAKRLGWVYDDTLKTNIEQIKEKLKNQQVLESLLHRQIIDKPLSDIGKRREISFSALGIKWIIIFNNDFKTNAAGEQFVSILQVLLTELASTDYDFNLLVAPVKIHLIISDQKSSPVQTPSNDELIWKVYIQEQKLNTAEEIMDIYSRMFGNASIILYELSVLPEDEFYKLYTSFIISRQLKEKTLIEHGYEYIYKKLFSEKTFNEADRGNLEPSAFEVPMEPENLILVERKGFSSKYDSKTSLENITQRYQNSLKHYHLTLEYYKNNYFFNAWIRDLRSAGWLDWQIGCGLMNAIINAKANDLILSRTYKTENARRESYENLLKKSISGDEADNFKIIELGRLMNLFDGEMEVFEVTYLRSFGLYNKPNFPNFKAVKNFNADRLNFKNDDLPLLSPLKDIGINISDDEILRNIQGIGFFIMENDSPPVFHLQTIDHFQSLALLDNIRKVVESNEVTLKVIKTESGDANVIVEGVTGKVIKFEHVPMLEDLSIKIKEYSGDARKSMFATSHIDVQDNKLRFAAIETPLMTTNFNLG